MLEPDTNALFKASLRRKLTPEEEERLRAMLAAGDAKPEDREAEYQLNRLLGQLPDVPVASNFTSQVRQLVLREAALRPETFQPTLTETLLSAARGLFRPAGLGLAGLVLVAALGSYKWHQAAARQELARSIATVYKAAALPAFELLAPGAGGDPLNAQAEASIAPPLEVLANFEAIRRLQSIPKEERVDVELLAALQ